MTKTLGQWRLRHAVGSRNIVQSHPGPHAAEIRRAHFVCRTQQQERAIRSKCEHDDGKGGEQKESEQYAPLPMKLGLDQSLHGNFKIECRSPTPIKSAAYKPNAEAMPQLT